MDQIGGWTKLVNLFTPQYDDDDDSVVGAVVGIECFQLGILYFGSLWVVMI